MLFSGVFAITERRDVELYEVPLLMSFGGDRDNVIQFSYVCYYGVVNSSFKHTREDSESKREYVLYVPDV